MGVRIQLCIRGTSKECQNNRNGHIYLNLDGPDPCDLNRRNMVGGALFHILWLKIFKMS